MTLVTNKLKEIVSDEIDGLSNKTLPDELRASPGMTYKVRLQDSPNKTDWQVVGIPRVVTAEPSGYIRSFPKLPPCTARYLRYVAIPIIHEMETV